MPCCCAQLYLVVQEHRKSASEDLRWPSFAQLTHNQTCMPHIKRKHRKSCRRTVTFAMTRTAQCWSFDKVFVKDCEA